MNAATKSHDLRADLTSAHRSIAARALVGVSLLGHAAHALSALPGIPSVALDERETQERRFDVDRVRGR
jgi:hypothetical protein